MQKFQKPKIQENKRKFARIEIEIAAKFIQLDKDSDEVAYIHDVSAGGVSLVTTKRLQKDSPLELQLRIPDEGKSVSIKGKVVWIKPSSPNSYRLGVSVENIDLNCLSRILKLKLL